MTSIWLGQKWVPRSGWTGAAVTYDGDRHLTIFGPTGSGKSLLEIGNLLSLTGINIISVDPKGENAAVTAAWRRTVSDVLVFNPFGLLVDQYPDLSSAGFNPLAALDPNSPRFFDDAAAIAEALIKVEGDSQPHFPESARGLLQALIMWEVVQAWQGGATSARPARQPLLDNVRRMLTEAETTDAKGRPEAGLRYYAAQMVAFGGPQVASLAGRFIETSRELGSVRSTADTQTRWLLSDAIRAEFAKDGLDFRRLKSGARPVTVYIILPADYLDTQGGSVCLRLLITAALNALYRHGGQGGRRTLFLLSEFAALGRLESVAGAMAQGRAYQCQLAPVLQDINQLRSTFGRDLANTFLGMSGATFAFAPNDPETAEWMSRRSGEIAEMGLSASDDPNSADGARVNYQERRRRVFAPDDLFNLPKFHGLVWFAGQSRPQPVHLPPYWKTYSSRARPNPYRPPENPLKEIGGGILAAMAKQSWIFNAAVVVLLLAAAVVSGKQAADRQPVFARELPHHK
jgi:type IV secretion system protein VirD4